MKPLDLEILIKNTFREYGIDASDYTDLYAVVIRPLVNFYSQLYSRKNMITDSLITKLSEPNGLTNTLFSILSITKEDYATGTIEVQYDLTKFGDDIVKVMTGLYFEYKGKLYTLNDFNIYNTDNKAQTEFKSVIKVSAEDVSDMVNTVVKIMGDDLGIITNAEIRSVIGPSVVKLSPDEISNILHNMKIHTTQVLENYLTEILNTKVKLIPYHSLPNYHGII